MMQPKRYHVIVSGTEFYLDVEQTGGTSSVPMICRQDGEQHNIWHQASKDMLVKNTNYK